MLALIMLDVSAGGGVRLRKAQVTPQRATLLNASVEKY